MHLFYLRSDFYHIEKWCHDTNMHVHTHTHTHTHGYTHTHTHAHTHTHTWIHTHLPQFPSGRCWHRSRPSSVRCTCDPAPECLSVGHRSSLKHNHISVVEAVGIVLCLSKQHASVSQGRFCSDNLTCCYTEIEVADQTFHLTQSQYTNIGPTSPSTDPINARRLAE